MTPQHWIKVVFALTLTDAGAWVALISGALGAIGSLVISIVNAFKQARTARAVETVSAQVNTAADAATLAASKAEETKKVQEAAIKTRDEKLAAIHAELTANTKISKEAFTEANNVNTKLKDSQEATLASAKAIESYIASQPGPGPTEVVVVNSAADPVIVTEAKPTP